jgi:hypothetical protein
MKVPTVLYKASLQKALVGFRLAYWASNSSALLRAGSDWCPIQESSGLFLSGVD